MRFVQAGAEWLLISITWLITANGGEKS